MLSKLFQARWHQAAFLMLTLSILTLFIFRAVQPDSKATSLLETRNQALAVENVTKRASAKNAVALGHTYANDSFSSIQDTDGQGTYLRKRAPRTLSYYDAFCKGERNFQLIQRGNPNGPVVVRQQELDDGGWSVVDDYPRDIEPNILDAVKHFGVSTDHADIIKAAANQYSDDFVNQNGNRDWKEPSGATYIQYYIPKSGAIIAANNISPEQNIIDDRRQNNRPPPTAEELRQQTPKVRRWSDLVWFLWLRYAGDQAGKLKYIFRENLVNDDTRGVIDDIFGTEYRTLYLSWPGKSFDIRARTSESGKEKLEGDDARALLGTPHGVGISHMLGDHKDVLGDRTIRITVFTSEYMSEGLQEYFMAFELLKI